jgi:hypothetical protein
MFWMTPHRGAGQAFQVGHDELGTFYETIKFEKRIKSKKINAK